MKLCKMFVLFIGVLMLASASYPALAADEGRDGWPAHLRVLTGPNGGQWFMMGDPIAQALSRHVLPSSSRMGGGVANIAALNKRQGDIAFTLACLMGAGQSGLKEYEDLRLENTSVMANVYPQVLYILIREEVAEKYAITTARELFALKAPLRFASLRPGTASEFILSLLMNHGYNTNFDSLREQGWSVFFNNYAETADNFVDGELDCFAYTAGTEVPLILTMEDHTGVRILPVEEDVLELLHTRFATDTYVIQPGIYDSVQKPVRTLGDYTCLAVRADLPDSLVAAVCKVLWEEKDAIAGVISDFGQLSPKTALPDLLEVHPGARAFWESLNR